MFSADFSFGEDKKLDDNEAFLEEDRCLYNSMRITVALKLVVLIRLILNLILLYIAFDTIFVYVLAFAGIGNFTFLCILLSGLLENEQNHIRCTKLWMVSELF
ncbi:hypothetical protein AB6A40_006815 [Gnathostoma spinigerum]|uniref:Uncharacterized protein n=1 Tax=Gnathostoma spinigerum TaxID=75299 RepID=A0ABD6EK20_9BILA